MLTYEMEKLALNFLYLKRKIVAGFWRTEPLDLKEPVWD